MIELPEGPFDAVFCDVGLLPVRGLLEAAGFRRNGTGANGVPVVVVSWLGLDEEILECVRGYGAGCVLGAPWDRGDLERVLARALSGPSGVARPRGELVLVVDDEPGHVQFLCQVLRDEGYEPIGVGSAAEAEAVARRERPHLLLVDNRLPDVDGVSLVSRLRRLFPAVAAVVMTAYGDETTARSALLAGADDYLVKPIAALELSVVVRQALERRLLRQLERRMWAHHRRLAETVACLQEKERREVRLQDELYQAEKLATLGTLLSAIAHELNNPLCVIVGFASLVVKEIECPEDIRGMIGSVLDAGERCQRIVEDLLGMARKSRGRERLTNLHEPIENVVRLRQSQLMLEGIRLEMDLDPELPRVVADPHKIIQLILNLVNNAADALLASKTGRLIRVRTGRRDAEVVVSVHDDGPSIEPELLEHLFEPFFTTKAPGKGTGLGLAICRDIVEGMGGELTVENLASGVTFSFSIPLDRPLPDGDDAGPLPRVDGAIFQGAYILVVDDEPDIVQYLRRALTSLGAQVECAGGGGEALSRLAARSFDLVICDLRMPGVGGAEVYEYLEAERPEMLSRFLFATGDMATEATRDILERVVNPTLPKPYTLENIRQAVGEALEGVRRGALAGAPGEDLPQPRTP